MFLNYNYSTIFFSSSLFMKTNEKIDYIRTNCTVHLSLHTIVNMSNNS